MTADSAFPGALPDGPLVGWYGDDFTGAAAVMEVLTFAGLPSILFLDRPDADRIADFRHYRGIGIAGSARSQGRDWMRAELPAVFEFLATLAPRVTHYKICSTLDSAPETGSIGTAAEIALAHIRAPWVGLLPAAPQIGRYQAFGTLFARAGDTVHRLDRHPVMARHPVTPMDEADVCLHLARQTDLPLGLVPLDAMADAASARARLHAVLASGARIVALDVVDAGTVASAGSLIWEDGGTPTLVIGSQGVEYALVAHLAAAGLIDAAPPDPAVAPVDRMAVVAGSVSSTTEAQIGWAEAHGFASLALDPRGALGPDTERARWVEAAVDHAAALGPCPIVYTARGPDDAAIAEFRTAAEAAGLAPEAANARLGAGLGDILAGLLERGGASRAVIAGGDTSSHAARRLGIDALTVIAATVPGAALCAAHRRNTDAPLEIALKGGQMGTTDYFGRIRNGGAALQTRERP